MPPPLFIAAEAGEGRPFQVVSETVVSETFSTAIKISPGCQGVAVTEQKLSVQTPGRKADSGVPCGIGR
jgi:hypothetical protein